MQWSLYPDRWDHVARPSKRSLVLDAARRAFARSGYAVGIDEIAADAEVSTRTIYNHFPAGKDELLATAVAESATRVADALCAVVRRHLDEVTDIEATLVALAHDWLGPREQFPDHFAMVRKVQADPDQVSAAVRDAWHEAGPERAVGVLAEHLAACDARGLLTLDDPRLAASHFLYLALGEVLEAPHAADRDPRRDARLVEAGVAVFLRGYEPR